MVFNKQTSQVSKLLTGESSPGKRGIIPTAILGTGVDVSLRALDSTLLGNRLSSVSIPLPGIGSIGIIDGINFLIFFSGKGKLKSGITAVVGAKLITGAVSIGSLVGGLPGGIAAAGGSSGVAAGAEGAPV